jgi:hypothetical protein
MISIVDAIASKYCFGDTKYISAVNKLGHRVLLAKMPMVSTHREARLSRTA